MTRSSDARADADDLVGGAVALGELFAVRSYLYALFQKLLATAPDQATLDALQAEATRQALGVYIDDCIPIRGFLSFIGELAELDQAKLLEDARDEYTRIFIGPGSLPAPAFESPYLTNDETIFQTNTIAVRQLYHEKGWEAKREMRVPDDSIALMCDFIAQLGTQDYHLILADDRTALSENLRFEQTFVHAHMNDWFQSFAEGTRNQRIVVIYPQILEALSEFTKQDEVFLGEAAYWIERHAIRPENRSTLLLARSLEEDDLARMILDAHAKLERVRPYGIEDGELRERRSPLSTAQI